MTDNVVLSSDQRVLVLERTAALRTRSRADPSRDDKVSRIRQALRNDSLFFLWVILVVLAWISVFETDASGKLRVVEQKTNKLSKSLERLFLVDR